MTQNRYIKEFLKKNYKKLIVIVILLWYLFFSLPSGLFEKPTSTVIFDSKGELLGAKLADDEQWRFSEIDSIPSKFKKCILQFEDAYFYKHPGFNPISISKALIANLKAKKIVRGGSTITMQTIRLSRDHKKRTIYQKLIELVLATRLELTYSKEEILKKYVSNTPYGSNIVGLSAASWRYYGRSPHSLSWGESATLAVLPNAPSLLYPGKNHDQLKKKRDRLLTKLWKEKVIDSITSLLAKQEPIPSKPKPLPNNTQHLLFRATQGKFKGKQLVTTLSKQIQDKTVEIIERDSKKLKSNHIYNSACVIIDIETAKVLAYVGNSKSSLANQGKDVDIITAPRSTGSILKPFLYASALEDGLIVPQSLLQDIPIQIAGYSPENYNKTYSGAVPAKEALARSLNIPAIRLLRDYKYARFHEKLKKLGLTTLYEDADRYGLSLILGGAEANLWELTGLYASLARSVGNPTKEIQLQMPHYIKEEYSQVNDNPLDLGAIYLMFEAMKSVGRPNQEMGWQYFAGKQQIAWKTGTSFGNRDAWAIGVSNKYAVGVWVGNADGEGRATLTGIDSAAPILFDVFKQFDTSKWYEPTYDFLREVKICKHSGYRANRFCTETKHILAPRSGSKVPLCKYHKKIHLSLDGAYQVNSSCEKPHKMKHENWFVLPPIVEWYYKQHHKDYKVLPPFKRECNPSSSKVIEIIYPKRLSKLFIPKEINGERGALIFKVAHSIPSATLFWHIDNEFIGSTHKNHEIAIQPLKGKHNLTLVDSHGNRVSKVFEIIE